MKTRTSWREKLEKVKDAKIVQIPPKMRERFGTGTMLIPKPLDVDELIRKIHKGKLVTQSQIRERLAKNFKVDVTCPITTGIFVRISAEASEEDSRAGKREITPYWRVIKPDGGLIEKFPGGVKNQAARLQKEGHQIELGGKNQIKVMGFERDIQEL